MTQATGRSSIQSSALYAVRSAVQEQFTCTQKGTLCMKNPTLHIQEKTIECNSSLTCSNLYDWRDDTSLWWFCKIHEVETQTTL